ncbi:protoporphyrinogen oxidase HemJ [Sulfurimonas lithotrophica]|uniref:Protoporphyrinogen IX oxidase n=1 Tax=Sulfurimonas lithotrophica TaxID=2590022 RepID=A0A5P8P2L8_9BACT|nr:protoporphyrinogen oxidase HemJ [Sulfurimonas lithotrophica]QFR49906.1 protoporphyrinogen oxidase HemJ [Sulfurimonas lithotrophica]
MYSWVLWFHLLSLISWFAVLFYMPRLFVYHAENIENKGFCEVVKVMEMKIYKYIGVPAMWGTILSGFYLAFEIGFKGNAWLHVKITLVVLLMAYFFSLGYYRKQFLEDKCDKSGKFFRAYNEVPTLILLIVVWLVVFKPF